MIRDTNFTKVNWIIKGGPVKGYKFDLNKMQIDSITSKESVANKRLIQSAPNMLDSLQIATTHIDIILRFIEEDKIELATDLIKLMQNQVNSTVNLAIDGKRKL